jgi:hypothetical protein
MRELTGPEHGSLRSPFALTKFYHTSSGGAAVLRLGRPRMADRLYHLLVSPRGMLATVLGTAGVVKLDDASKEFPVAARYSAIKGITESLFPAVQVRLLC